MDHTQLRRGCTRYRSRLPTLTLLCHQSADACPKLNTTRRFHLGSAERFEDCEKTQADAEPG